MTANAHSSHGGHETTDIDGRLGLWAIPFSMVLLVIFLVIVTLWVPSAATREMKLKESQGAEAGRQSLLDHRAREAGALGSIEEAMAEVVRERAAP